MEKFKQIYLRMVLFMNCVIPKVIRGRGTVMTKRSFISTSCWILQRPKSPHQSHMTFISGLHRIRLFYCCNNVFRLQMVVKQFTAPKRGFKQRRNAILHLGASALKSSTFSLGLILETQLFLPIAVIWVTLF